MENKIKSAFDEIHAENTLKAKTKSFIYKKTNGYSNRNKAAFKPLVTLTACLFAVLVGAGGYISYSIPVAAISIDINPSVEIEINMYDKVIDVKGYNSDGAELSETLEVCNMDYSEAVRNIMENEQVLQYLKSDNLLEVTVSSGSEKKSDEMRECILSQTDVSTDSIFCSHNRGEAHEAHEAGLSLGKYRAFLELQDVMPDITIEDVQGLTMRELRNMIECSGQTCSDNSSESDNDSDCDFMCTNGQGQGKGNGNGNGNHHGSCQH